MQDNPNSISINSNQQTRRNDQRVKQLKTQVILTQKDLQSLLAKSGKFASKVIEFNHLALENMHNDRLDEALVYLVEAEKILQKAGEKCMDVQKKLIILTLHNLACCYQKNWELEICSNYLQALIYNLNLILKNVQMAPSSILGELSTMKQNLSPVSPQSLSSKSIQLMLSIEIKQRLGRYYLQFCAVNSQIRNHSGALISARKSIQTMKKMFQQLTIFLRHYNTRKQGRQQFEQKLRLIHQVSKLNDNINVSQYEMILDTTKFYLRRWQSCEEKDMVMSQISTEIEAKFRNFSIGTIAQMNPVEYDELFMATQVKKNELLKTQSIIEKVLVLIIGYFTISTELRLLAESKNPISQVSQPNHSTMNQEQLQQTRQAQIFHLFSIMLSSIFIPFQILYMKKILLSYKNHYALDLFDEKGQISENNKVYDQFLFTISQIRKGSMLGIMEWEESLKVSEIVSGDEANKAWMTGKDPFRKFSHIISNIDYKAQNQKSKSKGKRKTKSKSKSQNKKSKLKTISALSAHSKNKQKIQPTHSKSPQIHTQPSLSKGKNKKSSLKLPLKITSLQHMTEQNLRKKQKSKDVAKKKHQYAGIKTADVKKRKNINTIEQTNAYFLKKTSISKVKSQSKSKSKDSKIKKEGLKGLTPNNPTELYFHKGQKVEKSSKSKSKQKTLKKRPNIQKLPNTTSPVIHSKKSLYTHYL